MNDDQAKKTPISDLLLHWSCSKRIVASDGEGGTMSSVANIPPDALKEAADRIIELTDAAREVARLCATRSIAGNDGPGNAALAELRALVE